MIAAEASMSGPTDPQRIVAASSGSGSAAAIVRLMRETLRGVDTDRLERSCNRRRDSIRFGIGAPGIERAEVYLSACAFEPHRHDTYTIGVTTAGVQTFRYRGMRRVSLPGQLVILHPDEMHDGAAGTDDGFGYQALYLPPELVHDALDHSALPFVADPVQKPARPTRLITALLADIDEPISDLGSVDIAAMIADTLRLLGGESHQSRATIDFRAVELARDYLAAHAREQTSASTLEQITGADRFTLARHFRQAFGTSPDRYRTMRRLELARTAIEKGRPLAQAAAEAGFADQSHMTRQFKRTYGLTPARWTALTAA
jgi:AraC-like DNA-binding protein